MGSYRNQIGHTTYLAIFYPVYQLKNPDDYEVAALNYSAIQIFAEFLQIYSIFREKVTVDKPAYHR